MGESTWQFERKEQGCIFKHTARPTAPRPKIATVEPFFGFATFKAAPNPAI